MNIVEQVAQKEREVFGMSMREKTAERMAEAGLLERGEDGRADETVAFECFWEVYGHDIIRYAYECVTRPILARCEETAKQAAKEDSRWHWGMFFLSAAFFIWIIVLIALGQMPS